MPDSASLSAACAPLGAEAADLLLAAVTLVVDAEVEPVAPRAAGGAGLADASPHGPDLRRVHSARGHSVDTRCSSAIVNDILAI